MTAQEKTLHIDIPVKLAEVKIVFSVASLSFEGDLPRLFFTFSSSWTTSPIGRPSPRL